MTQRRSLDDAIAAVVAANACSGCGACTQLDRGLSMQLDDAGFLRPARTGPSASATAEVRTFLRSCPGVAVTAPGRSGLRMHPTMGPYVAAWSGWATDTEVRRIGSSGGVLTAISTWLLSTGRAHRVTGVAAGKDPRRTIPVTIMTREEALTAAGSRYAPVASASNPAVQSVGSTVIGKPCEIVALRGQIAPGSAETPLLLSFFCAGTPSAHATQTLLKNLGVPEGAQVDELWYRGRGWPGSFTARVGDDVFSTSYEESWGQTLGRATQWRCKICVDGTGESADIVAADYWQTDERGYPVFDEGDGTSALIARTQRGAEVIAAAVRAGVIRVEPLDMDDLAKVQPLQVQRRTHLLARLIGARLAGRRAPAYRGYRISLLVLLLRHPRQAVRVARGTWRRVRA